MKKTFTLRKTMLAVALFLGIGTAAVAEATVTLPYTEDFESIGNIETLDELTAKGWKVIDADGDGVSWVFRETNPAWGNAIGSASWFGSIRDPDNWLISPNVSGIKSITYYIGANHKNDYREHYSLLYSKTGTNIADFSELHSETIDVPGTSTAPSGANLKERRFNIPGGTKYIAWRHHNCSDQHYRFLDEITFSDETTEAIFIPSAKKLLTLTPPKTSAKTSVYHWVPISITYG